VLLNQQDNKYIKRQAGSKLKLNLIFLKRQFTAKVNLFWFPFLRL